MPKQFVKISIISILILFSISLNAQTDSTNTTQGVNITFFNGYSISYKWNVDKKINHYGLKVHSFKI